MLAIHDRHRGTGGGGGDTDVNPGSWSIFGPRKKIKGGPIKVAAFNNSA